MAASFLILLVAVGIGLYAPPVFLVPLQEHFGWSRAAIAGGSAMAALTVGLVSPLVGVWIDRYGSRRVMTLGALAMAGGFASLSLMRSLWHLYAINMVVALGIACLAWIPNQTLVSNWFDRKRGLAMGIALAGIGFGGLAMAPLAALLIARLGWRLAFASLASLLLLVATTVILAVVRSRPADLGLIPDGERTTEIGEDPPAEPIAPNGAGAPGLELSEVVRTSAFWILSLGHLLWAFASMSIIGHLAAFLSDVGFESQTAATSLGLAIGVSVVGRVIFGVFADRFPKKSTMCAALIALAVSAACLLTIHSPGALSAFVILFGIGIGGGAVLVPLLVGEYFGLASFGKTLGLIMISATVGAAVGPLLTGRIYDVTGSYRLAFLLHIAAFAIAALAIYLLRRPDLVGARLERSPTSTC